MDYDVRYCTSADGTRIAYTVTPGQDPALLFVTGWPSVIEGLDASPFILAIRHNHKMVAFDRRGMGRSQRDVEDISLNRQTEDVEAVVNASGLAPLDIHAGWDGSPIAIAFAARHPESVSRLALAGPYARGTDIISRAALKSTVEMARTNWALTRRSLAAIGGQQGEGVETYMETLRRAVTPEIAARYLDLYGTLDAAEYLDDVRAPAIVIHRPNDGAVPRAASESVASRLSDCRFVVARSREESIAQARSFLWPDEEVSGEPAASGTAIILFADIVDSTALTERLGDAAFREKARALDEAMRTAIRSNGGTPVEGKTLGDGVLAVFTSARQAITCAQACHDAASGAGLALHVGIHAGDVIRESDPDGRGNVYGGAVNIAARVAAASAPGETLVSATVRDLARTSASVSFEDRGEQALKGIDDPVRLFVVR